MIVLFRVVNRPKATRCLMQWKIVIWEFTFKKSPNDITSLYRIFKMSSIQKIVLLGSLKNSFLQSMILSTNDGYIPSS